MKSSPNTGAGVITPAKPGYPPKKHTPVKPFNSASFTGLGFNPDGTWVLSITFNLTYGSFEYLYGPGTFTEVASWQSSVFVAPFGEKSGPAGGIFFNAIVRSNMFGKFPSL